MEPAAPSLNPKLRLLCSHGGRIMALPPENILYYIGGETRLVVVPRDISFLAFFELLSHKLLNGRSFSLKYRLPGCDLDTLITVSNYEDLQNMIVEYDSTSFDLHIRLFLFPLNHSDQTRNPVSVNQLLGLEPLVQEILYTSSHSVVPLPIFPFDNGPMQSSDHKIVDANSVEENGKQDETAFTTIASLLPSENTVADDTEGGGVLDREAENTAANDTEGGGVSDREAENVENQNQPLQIVQQQYILCYVPVLTMQPHS